jgi:alkaline phosphatase D
MKPLTAILLLLLTLLLGCATPLAPKRTDKLSILQGVTSTRSVEFSVLAPKAQALRFELRSAEGEVIAPEEVRLAARDFSDFQIHKLIFLRDPAKDYNIYVFEGEKLLDQRLVGRGQLERNRLRLAVASCMNDFMPKHFGIWDALAGQNPEYLLLIGDNVYADKTGPQSSVEAATPEILWNRYVDVRLRLPLYFQEKLIPVHALWDDHDYGMNNSGEAYPHREASREVFNAFWAQELSEDDFTKGLGVGGQLTLGDFNLYFLDARSFRAASKEGRHLGENQEAWLLSRLSAEPTPSLLIKGDQFFGGYHRFESWEGNHPKNFESFTAELRRLSTPVVFVSGDRHFSEIMQFPRSLFAKPSFEITSSPMHATLYPNDGDENPWRVVANKNQHNFTILNNLSQDDHWFIEVESIGEKGESVYRRELAVFIKDLQNNLDEVRKKRSGTRRFQRVRRR